MNNISDKKLKVEIKEEVKEEMLEMFELYIETIDNANDVGTYSSGLEGKCNNINNYLMTMI